MHAPPSYPVAVRPASPADLPAAGDLFELYPYKKTQQIAQRLDPRQLLAFYRAGLEKALGSGAAHWVAEREPAAATKQILALAGLADDPWHSQIYGMSMGKVQPWLNTVEAKAAGAPLLTAVEAAARARGMRHLSIRIDGEDFANLHLLEAAGWRLVDVSLKFSRPMPIEERRFPNQPTGARWNVDLARTEDAPWIRELAGAAHTGTHYLNDPALDPIKTGELFARWIDRCIEGLAYRIYTLADEDGRGHGFVTYLRAGAFARAVGRAPIILDFVLLDPALRGAGLGPWFIEESLAREAGEGFDYCELRTSAHNLPAVAGYEKLGFRCCASDFVLHRTL